MDEDIERGKEQLLRMWKRWHPEYRLALDRKKEETTLPWTWWYTCR
jgi:hypothetical protein